MRELQVQELELVAGGGRTNQYYNGDTLVTEYFDDADTFTGASYSYSNGGGSWFNVDGRSGSWSGSTGYWSIGGALGLGFGLWGTSTGDWGISWNAGIGAYVVAGQADSAGAAIKEVTEDKIVVGFDLDDVPTQVEIDPRTGEITYDSVGFSFGIFASDPEYPTDPREPRWVVDQPQ